METVPYYFERCKCGLLNLVVVARARVASNIHNTLLTSYTGNSWKNPRYYVGWLEVGSGRDLGTISILQGSVVLIFNDHSSIRKRSTRWVAFAHIWPQTQTKECVVDSAHLTENKLTVKTVGFYERPKRPGRRPGWDCSPSKPSRQFSGIHEV